MIDIRGSIRSYSVTESSDLAAALREAVSEGPDGAPPGGNLFCLIDAAVARLHARAVDEALPGARVCAIEATERHKSIDALQGIIVRLLDAGVRRRDRLLVVGGGVVQDVGCFIASVLFRGIDWQFVPTTLLAQCDSCIGSKSSINVGTYKNQIGTFFPPSRVRLVFDLVKTLPADQIRSGVGEIIKLHLIAGGDEFERMRRLLGEVDPSALSGQGPAAHHWGHLRDLTLGALRIKKRFIEEDEFDTGVRNLLNYGHTFGHAFESATDYGVPHGIAVSLGVAAATHVSESLGLLPAGSSAALDALLRPWYDPYQAVVARANFDSIVSAMLRDKKNVGAAVTCILTRGPGRMEKVSLDPRQQLRPLLQEFIRTAARP